jgi:hypothetical protein
MKKITEERFKELLKEQRKATWTEEEKKELKRLITGGLTCSTIVKENIFPDKKTASIKYMIEKIRGSR